MCSIRMRSTVALNEDCCGDDDDDGDMASAKGESVRGEDLLLGRGLLRGDWLCEKREKRPLGVFVPGVSDGLLVRCSASVAALRRRLVVPRAFVDPERAEQTTATLCWSM